MTGAFVLLCPRNTFLIVQAISGEMLVELSADDLLELGVTNRFHRGRISREIRRLKQRLTRCDQETVGL